MWLPRLKASARNCSRFDSVIWISFTSETSILIQRMDRRKPIGVSPKPYPGPTSGEDGLTKHEGLYHCDSL